jgi:inosose dehydratase
MLPPMQVRMSTAPGTWGVEAQGDPGNPPWSLLLSEIADLGFEGTELGPLGYLPERPGRLREELAARSLALAAGFVMEPFHEAARRARILEVARRTCALLRDAGGRRLILIEALVPGRARCAGRSDEAPRLDGRRWRDMVRLIDEVADVARDEELDVVFHPHVGTYVEFADELARLMDDVDDGIGLCLDTGHAAYAAMDPVDLLRVYGERVRHVHLKDLRGDVIARGHAAGLGFADAVAAGAFCALGSGDVDFASVRTALDEVGYRGWATVEQDRLPGDPRASQDARTSLEHLRRVGLASGVTTEEVAT